MELFDKNLKLLKASQPSLARRVEREPRQTAIEVVLSKDGFPVPQIESVSLHSKYYPLKEATRDLNGFDINKEQHPVVYGLGFGYHIVEILKKNPVKKVLVIEPLMTLFQAFMETVEIEPFILHTKFIIAEPPPKILVCHDTDNWSVFEHLPSRRLSSVYFDCLDRARDASIYLNTNKLKVLVVNPYYGGSLPTAKYCIQALNNLGHTAESVECEKFVEGYLSLNNVTQNKINTELLSKQFNIFMGQLIAAKAADFKPDLIFALAQAPLGPDAIKNLQLLKVPLAFWFVEDFRTLTYWKEIAPCYDYFFAIQRGEFFKELRTVGAQNHYYLPQACLPDVHRKVYLSCEDKKEYSADVSFMGAGYYNRAQSFPRLLDHDFKIWGTEWILESPLGTRVQNNNKRIDSEEIVKIYNAGKININLHSSSYHTGANPEGDFVNPRTFEIMACGGFQLVDARSELDELMNPDLEISTFHTIDELCQKVDFYLNHEKEAQAIAARGKTRVLEEHTMEHRMREMLIHVFTNNLDQLKKRLNEDYRKPVNYCISEAGTSTNLGKYLEQFRGENNFSMETMVNHISKGKGNLNKQELLILMVDQLVKSED